MAQGQTDHAKMRPFGELSNKLQLAPDRSQLWLQLVQNNNGSILYVNGTFSACKRSRNRLLYAKKMTAPCSSYFDKSTALWTNLFCLCAMQAISITPVF